MISRILVKCYYKAKKWLMISSDKFASFIKLCIAFVLRGDRRSYKEDVLLYAKSPIMFGVYSVLLFIVFGGSWAIFAPLARAAHATGFVISQLHHQSVQNNPPHGGRVLKTFVRQGEFVNANQVLLELEGKEYRAKYLSATEVYLEHLANYNRLCSELDVISSHKTDQEYDIKFDDILLRYKHMTRVQSILNTQTQLFNEIMLNYNQSISILEKKVQQNITKQIALDKNVNSANEYVEYYKNQFEINKKLEKEGFATKSSSDELYVKKVEKENFLKSAKSESINGKLELQNLKIQLIGKKDEYLEKILKEAGQAKLLLLDAYDKKVIAQEALRSLYIRSPIAGIVNYITKDSNIPSNQPHQIVEVTPFDEDLVVEVRIPNDYIDYLHIGQESRVKFASFKSRISPVFKGTLISLSPNIIQNQQQASASVMYHQNQKPCYTGLIRMHKEDLDKFLKPRNLKLITGMAADVQIVTGERTLLRYLLDPVLDQTFKALNEK